MKDQLHVSACSASQKPEHKGNLYVPYPGADEKYDDGKDWRIYNPAKYHDPNWSPDKE